MELEEIAEGQVSQQVPVQPLVEADQVCELGGDPTPAWVDAYEV